MGTKGTTWRYTGPCVECGGERGTKFGRICNACANRKNKLRHPGKSAESAERWRLKIKDAFFSMYGRECACCGEANPAFLTVQHKPGNPHGTSPSADLHRATKEYKPALWETLCYNCNCGSKRRNECPHQETKYVEYVI